MVRDTIVLTMSITRLSQPICKQCRQPILGEYITALDASWHPEHFLCAGCGKPIGRKQYYVHQGAPYHAECYSNQVAPHCAYCGKPLVGEYQVYEGKSYHPECFRDHVAPRCVYCGKPLTDEYMVNHWHEQYCKEHQTQYPACSFCGRLVPPQQQERGARQNEYVRCPRCKSSAIEATAQAQSIFTQLKQRLTAQGLMFNNASFGIELCDRTKIASLVQGRVGTDALGITLSTTHTINGHVVSTEVTGIAVLHGLPASLFRGVTMHELGHAWLVVQGIKGLPQWAEEGFCELLAYRLYAEENTAESRYHAANIEKNPDDVYGEGFRRVRAIVDAMGFSRFVETMRTTKRLPAG